MAVMVSYKIKNHILIHLFLFLSLYLYNTGMSQHAVNGSTMFYSSAASMVAGITAATVCSRNYYIKWVKTSLRQNIHVAYLRINGMPRLDSFFGSVDRA